MPRSPEHVTKSAKCSSTQALTAVTMASGASVSRRGTFPPRAAAPDPVDTPAASAAPPTHSLPNGTDERPPSFALAKCSALEARGRKKGSPDVDITALLNLKDGELLTSKKLSQVFVCSPMTSPRLQRRGMKSPASSPLVRRKNGLPAGRVCPRASSRLLSNRGDDEVAHRSILTISEDATISYVDEDEQAIDALLQAKAGGTMDGQSLRFRDPEHVRSVIDMLRTRDLSNEELSPRLRALGGGVLDDELESMVFDDGEISVRGASTSGMLRRAREFFDDGFSSADIAVVHAVLKSIPDSRSFSITTESSPSNHSGLSSSAGSGSSGPDSVTELAPGPAAANPFGDMADLFAVCNALSALMVTEEDAKGAIAGMIPMEDTHVPSDKERRRRSFERFYHDERGNEPLAAGHFDIEVIREELSSEVPDGCDPVEDEGVAPARLPVPDQGQSALNKLAAEQSESASEGGYRPRTTSRAKEPQLLVPVPDDSYRPRTSSKVIEPQLAVPVPDDAYRPRTSSKVIDPELPDEPAA